MRPEKAHIVADIQTKLKNSAFLLIADYSGMQVKHFEELRLRLARVDAEIHVIKNTFIKRAIQGLGLPELNGALNGQTAMVTGESDICAAAKVLKTFASEFERPPSKGAFSTTRSSTPNKSRCWPTSPPRISSKRNCSAFCSLPQRSGSRPQRASGQPRPCSPGQSRGGELGQ